MLPSFYILRGTYDSVVEISGPGSLFGKCCPCFTQPDNGKKNSGRFSCTPIEL